MRAGGESGDPERWRAHRRQPVAPTRLGDDAFGERTLSAHKYDDGTPDWYSFDPNG